MLDIASTSPCLAEARCPFRARRIEPLVRRIDVQTADGPQAESDFTVRRRRHPVPWLAEKTAGGTDTRDLPE